MGPVSPAGVVAYHTGEVDPLTLLTWYDRAGGELSTVGAALQLEGLLVRLEPAMDPPGGHDSGEQMVSQNRTL
ncbi:MAG TPA: hypothetical protein VMT16_01925 [Thermoanaerobaculia bacterium]|nr:hypothetical protein [Thermoanaerobaculia bacterium]